MRLFTVNHLYMMIQHEMGKGKKYRWVGASGRTYDMQLWMGGLIPVLVCKDYWRKRKDLSIGLSIFFDIGFTLKCSVFEIK